MEISDHEENTITVILVKGRLDASTAPQLQSYFEERLSISRRLFVLNLQDVDYVSSGGLRVLLIMTKKVNAIGGGIVLSNLHPFVEDLLTMAGFNKLLLAAASVEDAVKLLSQGEAL